MLFNSFHSRANLGNHWGLKLAKKRPFTLMQRSTCLFCWLIAWTIILKILTSNSWDISNRDSRPVNLQNNCHPKNNPKICFFCWFLGSGHNGRCCVVSFHKRHAILLWICWATMEKCCHVVHLSNLIELSYQSSVVTFQHRHPILLSWPLKSL